MEEIKTMLDSRIRGLIKDLSDIQPETKEMDAALENLSKLYKLRNAEIKIKYDYRDKCLNRYLEVIKINNKEEFDKLTSRNDEINKAEQLKEQKIDRYFKLGIDIAGIVLPMMFYATWMRKGFKFEENGTYTSTTFKGLFKHFKPTK